MFNECLFHLCGCTCSNVMYVCSIICGSNQKDFCSFCLLLEVIFITHVFQSFFQIVWKTCFLSVFMTYFMCKLSWELNGPILKFFSFTQRVSWLFRDCFASKAYQRNTSEISQDSNQRNYQWKFPNQLLKDISWNIFFKTSHIFSQILVLMFLHQNPTKFKFFHSINISKAIFNSFHWF